MTTEASTNILDAVYAREPRLSAIGDEQIRMTIASLMVGMGLDFSSAESKVLGLISNADAYKEQAAAHEKAKRAETEKSFTDAFKDLILESVKGTPVSDMPKGGFVITADPNVEYKNADGSPLMDSANNPVRGPMVTFEFLWGDKKAKSASTNANMGRPEGDYIIEGEATVYKSMAAFAKAKWASEYDTYMKESGASSRKFLVSKGYAVPDAPTTGTDSKKHWNITKAVTTNGAAA